MVRLRHRYIVAKINTDADWKKRKLFLKSGNLLIAVNEAIRNLHGIHGIALSKAGLFAKYINTDTKMCFIRMRRSAYKIVSSALPFVTKIEGEAISLQTLYTGATIRHCNLFLQKFHRRELEEKFQSLQSDRLKQVFLQETKKCPQVVVPFYS